MGQLSGWGFVFQSTLPHGERLENPLAPSMPAKFQSTLPHGERPAYPRRLPMLICFNPRSRTGSDAMIFPVYSLMILFQSTLPHGERRLSIMIAVRGTCFNPRSRTGSDAKIRTSPSGIKGFNPRSRTGSDCYLITL